MAKRAPQLEPPLAVIFTVELSNGQFKSQIRAPFPLPEGERDRVVEQWLDLMATGFRIGATSMDVALASQEPSS